ncbi:MAG: alpha/beta hydrolase [Chloroflexota bacterium]|nr:alpha/beta hydrolase [Chloroflexota bacterium]
MNRRTLLSTAALSGALLGGIGPLAVFAQDATPEASPEALAPPQDLLRPNTLEAEGQTADINGVSIYYKVYGEGNGNPILLLHGGLSNGDHFSAIIPALVEAGHEVVTMDSRGHGHSSFDDAQISYEQMARDVLGLMDHLKIDKADIVGWSDGGIIGLEIALTEPERLNKVVAYGANYDPSGLRLDVGTNDYFNAYIERASEEYQQNSPAPEKWDAFLANIGNMWATQPNYTDEQLTTITTPFLILDGAQEEAIDLNQTKVMALLIPDAELMIMPETGHFALFEQPEEFTQIVLDYLDA